MSRRSFAWFVVVSLGCCTGAAVAVLADDENALITTHEPQPAKMATGKIRRGEVGFRGIYTMNRDGTNVEYVTAAPDMISSSAPQWSHDSHWIAMDSCPEIDEVERSRIFVAAMDGPFKGHIVDLGYGNAPTWSPDDRQIAFYINPGNPIQARTGLWMMNADGTNRRWIADSSYPRWSPDGKWLCCDPFGASALTLVDPATGTTRPLWKNRQWRLLPYSGTWSPDSQRITLVGTYEGKDRLATIAVGGGDDSIQILYTHENAKEQLVGPPAWSPDGRQIVFAIKPRTSGEPRRWWKTFIYSIAADVPSAPVLLEGQKVGNVNRAMSFSRDGQKIIFSSER